MKRPCILLLTISLVGVAPPGIPLSTRAGATDEPVRAGSLLSASTPAEPLLQDVLGAPLRASSRATKENEGAFDVAFSASQWRPTTYDNDTFQLDGYNWYVSAEKSHSFAYDPSSGVYRFEVRD
ncbi:MAG TPA: hypothetical protein VEZ16_04600, partial [Microvirga sp.]|nr:hypothetical protein [Microvirga sp.]